jgi:hypothetical protein
MPSKTFEIDGRVHTWFEDGKLKLFGYINNEDFDIPLDWHTTEDWYELHLNFSIMELVNWMYENNRIWVYEENNPVHIDDKPQFMALREQLLAGLAAIDAVKFITEDEYVELKQDWKSPSDEQLSELIAEAGICLQNYCSEEKQKEFARAVEKTLKEMNK